VIRLPPESVAVTRVGTAPSVREVSAGYSLTLIFCMKARTAGSRNFCSEKLSWVTSPSNMARAAM
jgi:hypothetical protein